MNNSIDNHSFFYQARAHFDELDALWVLHHSRFFRHLERAQQALFLELLKADSFDPERFPDLYVVVKKIEIDFLAPLKGCVDFWVSLKVTRLREAGLTMDFEFLSQDRKVIHAKGKRTICKMSLKTHQPKGWEPVLRNALECMQVP